MIVTQSSDLRSVTVGRTVVTVEFEPAARRHCPGPRYAGWRCHWQNVPREVCEAVTANTSADQFAIAPNGSIRLATSEDTFAFAAAIVLAVVEGERST